MRSPWACCACECRYAQYVDTYEPASKELDKLLSKVGELGLPALLPCPLLTYRLAIQNETVAEMVNTAQTSPRCAGQSLRSLLIMPVQRVPRFVLGTPGLSCLRCAPTVASLVVLPGTSCY